MSSSHDKQDWEEEQKNKSLQAFLLKILQLFTESFSSEPWPISTCCMAFDEANCYNESIVTVGNNFPIWQRLDFRMLFTALGLTHIWVDAQVSGPAPGAAPPLRPFDVTEHKWPFLFDLQRLVLVSVARLLLVTQQWWVHKNASSFICHNEAHCVELPVENQIQANYTASISIFGRFSCP